MPVFEPKNPVLQWLEARLPILGLGYSAAVSYPTPRNLNYWWTFGAILTFMLMAQIVTGVILAMHYTPNVDLAFNSVEHIMRDVNYGWLLRYLHSNGASMFFLAVYIHIFRGMYYGSYKSPREVLWILGVIIYLVMMATGFMGYVLPWGQMSYWAATVITNLFSAIPVVGDPIVTWLWGGFSVGNPTLNRFYSLHYLLPFVILGVVVLHIWALHVVGQNNPAGIDPKEEKDTVAFTPYATAKDVFAISVFCIVYAWFVFYIPNYLGHADNYIPANPAVTPSHIVPEWYYLPFYAILRSIPNKLLGVMALFGSIAILAFLPWLDTSRVRSATYRPLYRQFFWIFVIVCIGLGWLGSKPAGGRLRARVARADGVVLPPLPRRAAAARPVRKAEAAADFDLAGGAREARRRSPRPRRAPRRRRAVPRDAGAGLGAGARTAAAAAQFLVVRRHVRPLRYRPAAARLQDLSARFAKSAMASNWWRSAPWAKRADRTSPRPRSRRSRPNTRSRTAQRPGRNVRAPRPAGRSLPAAVPQRPDGAPRQQRRPAARHVGARQGAPVRARLSLVPLRHLPSSTRSSASTTSSPSSRDTPPSPPT